MYAIFKEGLCLWHMYIFVSFVRYTWLYVILLVKESSFILKKLNYFRNISYDDLKNLISCWVIFHEFFYRLQIFSNMTLFQDFFSGMTSECQTAWIQIRTDVMSGLIRI